MSAATPPPPGPPLRADGSLGAGGSATDAAASVAGEAAVGTSRGAVAAGAPAQTTGIGSGSGAQTAGALAQRATGGPSAGVPAGVAVGGPGQPGGTGALPRPVVVVLGVAAAFVALQGMREYAGVIGPLFLSVVLVIAAHPLEHWLHRRGAPIWVTVLAMLAVIYGSLVAFLALLIVSIARLTALLPTYGQQFEDLQAQLAMLLADAGVSDEQIDGLLAGFDYGRLVGILTSFLSSMVGILTSLVLILCLLFFTILDAASFGVKTAAVARTRPDIARTLSAFARGTRRYLVVSTIFGLIVAVLDILALAWLGVSLPILWGLLGFVTNYIPNIGFFIGVTPPAFLALLESGWRTSLLVVLLYTVINFVIQSLIQPKFVGDSVGLSTTITFVSLILWAGVLGPLGALLAVPLTLLLKCVLLDADPSTRWASVLVGSGGAVAVSAPGAPALFTATEPQASQRAGQAAPALQTDRDGPARTR